MILIIINLIIDLSHHHLIHLTSNYLILLIVINSLMNFTPAILPSNAHITIITTIFIIDAEELKMLAISTKSDHCPLLNMC
jgi:hypothetical protein